MPSRRKIAALLFGSGFCALIYQVAWVREFRLIFGASTAASAAVLAIFIGGLGAGGVIFGRRADRHPNPLGLYARLEGLVAISAALSPALLWLVRRLYIALGGSVVLGLWGGTVVRLVLATLVLAAPTLLMGGTLPAAARAAEADDDEGRRTLAVIYGVNTLGAVTGSLASTFFMLEVFGTRQTLWVACLVNLLVAVAAWQLARRGTALQLDPPRDGEVAGAALPQLFTLGAAGLAGFAFFLMEMVWYRMLGPLLGGTVFTFGLILATALLGIGLGGAAYGLLRRNRPATLAGFAGTCLAEAALIALPFALGDRVAVLAALLRPLGSVGFFGFVLGWSTIAALLVLPAAFVAGIQFPLLIALLGRGREGVGRQTGLAYAWNTGGSILGSLAGGFGLLPLLTAPGCWRLVAALLGILGAGAMILSARRERRWAALGLPLALLLALVPLLGTTGPTAAWRHSPIGIGRVKPSQLSTQNAVRDWLNLRRRSIVWEAEGVETSVALDASTGLAFIINGKVDGHTRNDAPTTVMSGLVAALLHPAPKSALVIGLGTGSSAGWLGSVPGMERVDAVEIEPAILEVARRAAPVNRDVLSNPIVHIEIGDAREVLLTTPRRYDVMFSEPSNPYRAGIASLFTREYYQAAAARLTEAGIFAQWLQGYEVDSGTVRTVYATLASVFPCLETWRVHPKDLLLVASLRPLGHDVRTLKARIAGEPYRSALLNAWEVTDVEGFLSHFVAGPSFARAIAQLEGDFINTDDQNVVEFEFARSAGGNYTFDMNKIRALAHARHEDRPDVQNGPVDFDLVEDARISAETAQGDVPVELAHHTPDQRKRIIAQARYVSGNPAGALAAWRSQPREPAGPTELVMMSELLADAGDESALRYVEMLGGEKPAEALAAIARLRARQGRLAEAADALARAFARYQVDPWPSMYVMRRTLGLVRDLASRDLAIARRLFTALQQPFSLRALDDERARLLADLARRLGPSECLAAHLPLEPNVPWREDFLGDRLRCYARAGRPEASRAAADLAAFLEAEGPRFEAGLAPAGGGGM